MHALTSAAEFYASMMPSPLTSPAFAPLSANAVIAVIVTYVDRRILLRQVLDAVSGQGVGKVVVVDNGGRWPVKDELTVALQSSGTGHPKWCADSLGILNVGL